METAAASDRRAYLDGVRGLAALGVVLCHCGLPFCQPLGLGGVEVFFALSGFLITGILFRRGLDVGRLPAFWLARLRRLTPALLPMLAIVTAATAWVTPDALDDVATWCASAGLFVTDIERAGGFIPPFVGHTWTLAMEFQLYLAWPFVLIALRPVRDPSRVLWISAAALAVGAIVSPARLAEVNPWAFVAGGALAFRPIAAPAWVLRALAWRPLASLGLLSYGLYVWHYPISCAVLGLPWGVRLAATLPLSLLLSGLSYLTVERWAGCARAPLWLAAR